MMGTWEVGVALTVVTNWPTRGLGRLRISQLADVAVNMLKMLLLLLLLSSCTAFTHIPVESKVETKVDTSVKTLEYKHRRCSMYWMVMWNRR